MKIIRTKTKAKGGITPVEKKKLDKHVKLWIDRIMRTDPIEPDKIIPAIKELYKVSGLKEPRVIIVPSPFVAYLAGGLSSAICWLRNNGESIRAATDDATDDATRDATYAATYDATRDATYDATRATTYDATRATTDAATDDATRAATRAATYDATDDATKNKKHWLYNLVKKFTPNAIEFSIGCIKLSWKLYQGGNMWGQYDSYLTACRDVLGLKGLKCWDKYKPWEEAAIHGSWRIMHPEFCIVSDFPERLEKDEQNRPHSITGPSHRWRDGFEFYYIHGVKLEKDLWEKIVSGKMTAEEVFAVENTEHRRIAYEIMDKTKMKALKNFQVLDEVKDDGHGYPMKIISFKTQQYDMPFIYLNCFDPSTGREYFVETKEKTCLSAKNVSFGLDEVEWTEEY